MALRMAGMALRMAGMALRMAVVALRMAAVALRTAMMIVYHIFNHLANVRCNCWPFVQTSLSAKSLAMTGSILGTSMCSLRGKYKRYILATLYYISTICFMPRTYCYIL
jgi:hypothetical protein